MTLENQVVSLDLSKRLKELGFKQESLFYWTRDIDTGEYTLHDKNYLAQPFLTDSVPAYTVAELGEMLPIQECIIEEMVEDDEWYIKIEDGRLSDIKTYQEIANTEADARAKMLIYLKENNLI